MKNVLFALLITLTVLNNAYAQDDKPSLKDLFKNIVKDSVRITGDSGKKNKKTNQAQSNTKNDYKQMDVEGTFSINCDEIDSFYPALTFEEIKNEPNKYSYMLTDYSKKRNEKGTTDIWQDKDTGAYRALSQMDGIGRRALDVNFVLIDDGYIRMVMFDKDFKTINVLTKCTFRPVLENAKKYYIKTKSVKNSSEEELNASEIASKFDVKDLKIGGELPNNECPKSQTYRDFNLFSYQEFEDKALQKCIFDTTILDVLYTATVNLLDGKIVNVHLDGLRNVFQNKNVSYELKEYFLEMEFKKDDNIKNHIDTFVSKVSEKLGEPTIQRVKRNFEHYIKSLTLENNTNASTCKEGVPLHGNISYEVCMARFQSNLNELRDKFVKACGKCEYTEYIFTWDGDFKAELQATIPDYKNSPGILTSSSFKYTTKQTAANLDEYIKRKKELLLKSKDLEIYTKAVQDVKEKFNAKRNNDF